MSFRFMRTIVFFDLPVETLTDRKEYRRFRKFLLTSGFVMMQESVYCKLLLNSTAVYALTDNIKKNKPAKGLVQVLTVTEKQFARMEFVTGEYTSEVIDSTERSIIL